MSKKSTELLLVQVLGWEATAAELVGVTVGCVIVYTYVAWKKHKNQSHETSIENDSLKANSTSSSTSIPTLSEWKQIFLTLLMLSLVVGFVRNQSPKLGFAKGGAAHGFNFSNTLILDPRLYKRVMKWISPAVVLGLAGTTVIFGHVSMPDITGTLFCAPLVAYILHLMVLFMRDYKSISE